MSKTTTIEAGSEATYTGSRKWMQGKRVKVVKVWTNYSDEIETPARWYGEGEVDYNPATDLIEIASWIEEEGRWSWVTSDASLDELDFS